MLSTRYFVAIIFIALSLLTNACTTSVIKQHPSILNNQAQKAATVYILRPALTRMQGVADSDVQVEFGDKLAVLLSAGEYIALKINPGTTEITLRSHTYLASQPMPVAVHRSAEFQFTEGNTYFIHARFDQQEFRGIYFRPEEIDLKEAKSHLLLLKPHGELAKAYPISSM